MYYFQILLLIQAIGTVLLQTDIITPITRHPALISEEVNQNQDHLENIAAFDDAQHRGPNWYAYASTDEDNSASDDDSSYSSLSTSDAKSTSQESSDASSFETRERELHSRVYRTCTACPHEMLKSYKNMGIKWICGGYQRARRSFKSECMMRYRNCQDGTLFVKLYDHKCKNDSYHGRHFFYHYKT